MRRQRDRSAYRSRRPPKSRFGEMVPLDGSHHHWFEERGESCCLMSLVDDATPHGPLHPAFGLGAVL